MILRTAQFQELSRSAEPSLVERLSHYLRENHPKEWIRLPRHKRRVRAINEQHLRRLVAAGISRAKWYGIQRESNIAAFVTLMFVVAPNFAEHPVIARVFRDPSIPPEQRIDRLWQLVTSRDWAEVRMAYVGRSWIAGWEVEANAHAG